MALVLVFRRKHSIRIVAVGMITFALFSIVGFLIAPHRVAEELILKSTQSEEWQRGARDTRDVVYKSLPLLGLGLFSLAVIALIPNSQKPCHTKQSPREERGQATSLR